tara:strand:- start:129 stop:662 length:534 start_codon:yes stop_codon:yes gene_type:complete
MRQIATELPGAYLIELERHEDERGFFARTWCQHEFEEFGLDSHFVQCSVSFNRVAGTLRGMHYQQAPCEESKLVRCVRGSIFDAIVDIRPGSPTFGSYAAFELNEENQLAIYIPKGFAHGFQTLSPNTEVLYQMSEFFHSDSARGFHHSDPSVGIAWPLPVAAISEKDAELEKLAVE